MSEHFGPGEPVRYSRRGNCDFEAWGCGRCGALVQTLDLDGHTTWHYHQDLVFDAVRNLLGVSQP